VRGFKHVFVYADKDFRCKAGRGVQGVVGVQVAQVDAWRAGRVAYGHSCH